MARRSRSIPPVRWRRGMVGDADVLVVAAHLRSIAPRLGLCDERYVDLLPDGTLLSGFTPAWGDGSARVTASGDTHVDARPNEPILVPCDFGTLSAITFTVAAERRIGDADYADGNAATARVLWMADVMERAVLQDSRRLARHEAAAAATTGRLSALLTAHVADAEDGMLILPGPHAPFSFEPVRRDMKPAVADAGFDRMVAMEASLAPTMTAMSAVLAGGNLEVRLRSCRIPVEPADPMQTIRALDEIARLHGADGVEG